MRDSFIKKLHELTSTNKDLVLITGDLGFGVLDSYSQEYPDNYLNCGVAEQNMTAIAAGMALQEKIPFTYSIGNFPTLRCLEQIRNDIAYHDLPVKIVCIGGGFSYGQLGMSHHATEDLAILRSIPNISVYAPCSKEQVLSIVPEIIKKNSPCYLRLDKDPGSLSLTSKEFSFEKANILHEGNDLTIVSIGSIFAEAEKACQMLVNEGFSVELIAVHSLKPFDNETIVNSIKKTNNVITLEEHSIYGGLGSAVAELVAENGLKLNSFRRLGIKDEFSSVVGDQAYLRDYYQINKASVFEAAKEIQS